MFLISCGDRNREKKKKARGGWKVAAKDEFEKLLYKSYNHLKTFNEKKFLLRLIFFLSSSLGIITLKVSFFFCEWNTVCAC